MAGTTQFLGIEGGGTRTVAWRAGAAGKILQRTTLGPFNLKLTTDAQALRLLRPLRSPQLAAVSLCVAGCRTETDRLRLRRLVQRVFGGVPCFVGNDLDSGLAAAFGVAGDGILIISGTGSCVIGRRDGQVARVGGWGHLLGDHGSGYWIAITGLRHAIREYDRHGRTNERLLRRLHLQSYDGLVEWIQSAGKDEVAALANLFIEHDAGLMLQAASFLAQDCHAVATRLDYTAPRVALAGGILRHHRKLAILVHNRVVTMLPGATTRVLRGESVRGALSLAQST